MVTAAAEASGLTTAEAILRLRQDGPNEMAPAERWPALRELARNLANPLVVVLLLASMVSAVFGQFVPAPEILFPSGSQVFVVADFEGVIQPVLKNAVIFLFDAPAKIAARNVRRAQTPVLFNRRRLDAAAQAQVADVTECRTENVRLFRGIVQQRERRVLKLLERFRLSLLCVKNIPVESIG